MTAKSGYTGAAKTLAVSIFLFAILNAWVLKNAPVQGGDTHHFVDAVNELVENGSITNRSQNYSGYVIFLAICKLITPSGGSYFATSIAIQTLFSFIAMFCVFHLGNSVFSETTAKLATLFFSVNYYTIYLNQYVLTDSMFISLALISCSTLVMASWNRWWFGLAAPATIFTAMFRPNGIVFFPLFALYALSLLKAKTQAVIYTILVVALVAAGPFLLKEFYKATSRIQALGQIERGTVVYGYKFIEMPELKNKSHDLLKDTARYAMEYPGALLNLVYNRLYSYYFFMRDEFSSLHNMFLKITLPVFYLLALMGVARCFATGFDRNHLLLLGIIAAQSAITASAYSDHDPRFLCYIISLIALFSAFGLTWIVSCVTGIGDRLFNCSSKDL